MSVKCKCHWCGKAFSVAPYREKTAKYCCPEHFHKADAIAKRNKIQVQCGYCGEPFAVWPSYIVRGKGRFCCPDHAQKAQRDRIQVKCQWCGTPFMVCPNQLKKGEGKHCSNNCRGKAGDYGYRLPHRRGPDSPSWRGGVTPQHKLARQSLDYKKWRTAVFERDDYTCQDCGKRGGHLHAHHVFPFADFPEHRLEVWNGLTMCVPCHWKYHSKMQEATA